MVAELPEWPRAILEIVVDATADLLPERASLNWSPPTEAVWFWHLSLTPRASGAAELHLFVEDDPSGIDNFETGSRASSFELSEPTAERLARVRQIVAAVTGGHFVEEIRYVGDDPVEVELRLEIAEDDPTTYKRYTPPRSPRAQQRVRTNAFRPY
jgi:hypothetical protein